MSRRPDRAAAPRVGLLVGDAEASTGRHVVAALASLGDPPELVGATPQPSRYRAVVVLVGRASARRERWTKALDALKSVQLIPVLVEGTAEADVPPALRALNWIVWPRPDTADEEQIAAAAQTIHSAMQSDAQRQRRHRELAAEAQAWADGGRRRELLIGNRRRAREALQLLATSEDDPLTRPTQLTSTYVLASVRATKRTRRRRRWRWGRRIFIAGGTAATLVLVIVTLRGEVANNHLALQMAGIGLYQGRPDREATIAAAALLQGSTGTGGLARLMLREALSQPWGLGALDTSTRAATSDGLPLGDDRTVLTTDGLGGVVAWDARTAYPVWQRETGLRGHVTVAATPDAAQLALLAGSELALVRRSPWHVDIVRLPVVPTRAAIAAAAGVAIVDQGRRLLAIGLAAPHRRRTVAAAGPLLDLEPDATGGARALVRSRRGPVVLDAVSGRRLFPARPTRVRATRGAVAVRGRTAAITDPTGRLLVSHDGGPWLATGLPVNPNPSGVFTLLRDEVLAEGGWRAAPELLDLRHGLRLGPVCTGVSGVVSLRASPDGRLLACGDNLVVELWSTSGRVPLQRRPAVERTSGRAVARSGPLRVRGTRDGRLKARLAVADGSSYAATIQVGTARVGAVAIGADDRSIVAGTDDGRVVELDAGNGSLQRVLDWHLPDGAPIRVVGWSARAGRLVAGTADGLWWQVPSCDGCGSDPVALGHARERFWACYQSQGLQFIWAQTRRLLHLRVCPRAPLRAP